jgi:hypothetical protein
MSLHEFFHRMKTKTRKPSLRTRVLAKVRASALQRAALDRLSAPAASPAPALDNLSSTPKQEG